MLSGINYRRCFSGIALSVIVLLVGCGRSPYAAAETSPPASPTSEPVTPSPVIALITPANKANPTTVLTAAPSPKATSTPPPRTTPTPPQTSPTVTETGTPNTLLPPAAWPDVDLGGALLAATGISVKRPNCGLWLLEPDGRPRAGLPVMDWPPAPDWVSQIALSPDGHFAALTIEPVGGSVSLANLLVNLDDGAVIDIDALVDDTDPVSRYAWSPDGKVLSLSKAASGESVSYFLDVEAGELIGILPVSYPVYAPSRDERSRRLVYLTTSGGVTNLVVREDSGEEKILGSPDHARWSYPTWTSEDTVIVVEQHPDPDGPPWMVEAELVSFSLSSGQSQVLAFDRTFFDFNHLQLAPDGSRMLAMMNYGRGAGVVAYPVVFDLAAGGQFTGEYHRPQAEPQETWIGGLAYWAAAGQVMIAWPLLEDPEGPAIELYLYNADDDTTTAIGRVPDDFPAAFCP